MRGIESKSIYPNACKLKRSHQTDLAVEKLGDEEMGASHV